MYKIVWRYKVFPNQKNRFESEYCQTGSWSKLFGMDKNYIGTELHPSDEYPDTYLLIDKWKNKISYKNFLIANKDDYNRLNSELEHLYEIEEKVGSFYSFYS